MSSNWLVKLSIRYPVLRGWVQVTDEEVERAKAQLKVSSSGSPAFVPFGLYALRLVNASSVCPLLCLCYNSDPIIRPPGLDHRDCRGPG